MDAIFNYFFGSQEGGNLKDNNLVNNDSKGGTSQKDKIAKKIKRFYLQKTSKIYQNPQANCSRFRLNSLLAKLQRNLELFFVTKLENESTFGFNIILVT